MEKERSKFASAQGYFRSKWDGFRAALDGNTPQIVNGVDSLHVDDHELQVRLISGFMPARDRRRLRLVLEPMQDESEEIVQTHTLLIPKWLRRGRHEHVITADVNTEKLQEDPEKALEVINAEIDKRVKFAAHNMVHTHRIRSIAALAALFGVGREANNAYLNSPLQLPNITLATYHLPFEVNLPLHYIPTFADVAIHDVRLTTAFLVAAAVGVLANRAVHFIGEQIHEWRTDRKFASYDHVVAHRKPVITLLEQPQITEEVAN